MPATQTSTARRRIRWRWVITPPILLLAVLCVLFAPYLEREETVRRLHEHGVSVFYGETHGSLPHFSYRFIRAVPGMQHYGLPVVAADVYVLPIIRDHLPQIVRDLESLQIPVELTLEPSTDLTQDLKLLQSKCIVDVCFAARPDNKPIIPQEAVSLLRGMPHLETLSLMYCELDRQAFSEIGNLPSLKALHLDQSSVTDPDLSAFAKLSNLNYLSLSNTYVSDSAKERLQTALPRLDLTDD